MGFASSELGLHAVQPNHTQPLADPDSLISPVDTAAKRAFLCVIAEGSQVS